jgi:hypothetical protein
MDTIDEFQQIKESIQSYEINTETKPFKITMNDNNDYDNDLKKFEEDGIIKKKEFDERLKEKIEKMNKEIEFKNTEDQQRRDKITRVRTIALSNLNIHPLMHSNDLTDKQRNQMIKECNRLMETMSPEELVKKFNEVVCDEIITQKSDYTKYAIYHIA